MMTDCLAVCKSDIEREKNNFFVSALLELLRNKYLAFVPLPLHSSFLLLLVFVYFANWILFFLLFFIYQYIL